MMAYLLGGGVGDGDVGGGQLNSLTQDPRGRRRRSLNRLKTTNTIFLTHAVNIHVAKYYASEHNQSK